MNKVVVVIHNVYHWTLISAHQLVELNTEVTYMGLSIRHTLQGALILMDEMDMLYHVQFVMSVIVLQSTWFLLSTHAPQDGPESITMSQYHTHAGNNQFTSFDNAFKKVSDSHSTRYEALTFYFVEARCGVLPCPKYDNTIRVIMCSLHSYTITIKQAVTNVYIIIM